MVKFTYIFALSVILAVSVCAVCFLPTSAGSLAVGASDIFVRPNIVIDCGHGGEDGGAVSENGVLEKDLNLMIGMYLQRFFLQGGFEVTMIRTTDTAVYDENADTLREKKKSDIHNRTDIVNSNDNNILISIHQNKFSDSKYYGTQVFYSCGDSNSKILAESIRLAVKGLVQTENERQCKAATKDIYILDHAVVPAVLVECGFLSNHTELDKLIDTRYQKQLAYCIYVGFLEFYYNNYKI